MADERAKLHHPTEEIVRAVADEPTVKLSELDIDGWCEKVGAPPEFVERVRAEGL